ncbi:hypothetical protein APE02nite_10230 [Alkalibacterium pelagium]|uniref:Uncharacterized protein n=2 Tax=Alkalibacterium pelagium TaxID=426702 RepID=A0A1H7HS38_9LACT|nr:hypothetical protein [Alkalibacterium pelagium]GEN50358.1 hypothetical protein APE02nite_10230 [Alkalibacterium pelagium]SEK53166.1 hypothetical protein SAMN04488099_103163 [Alkalibacterium pelagium]
MNKQHLETAKQLEIKKAPEEQSTEAANNQYTKKQLTHFIEHHDLDIAKSWKKAEIVEALTEWMETAQKDVLDSNSDLQSFYSESVVNADESLNIYDDNLSDDSLENILKLVEHGLAYNVDGQLWVPAEISAEVSAEDNESSVQVDEPKKEAPKKQTTSNSQSKTTSHSASSSFEKAESIEDQKKARLEYLKKQAKRKKKGKKRK